MCLDSHVVGKVDKDLMKTFLGVCYDVQRKMIASLEEAFHCLLTIARLKWLMKTSREGRYDVQRMAIALHVGASHCFLTVTQLKGLIKT